MANECGGAYLLTYYCETCSSWFDEEWETEPTYTHPHRALGVAMTGGFPDMATAKRTARRAIERHLDGKS
ncbi:hypothetical protein LCGC14_2396840 [marine sediment metagenome]|uniref:Uncharacterized protein n=1 Tax=marine sediment metagenome TaxID=412755 RepID=A0A0F9E8X6_9ZZZZ